MAVKKQEELPVKKKRATPVKFNDEKIDTIVKEIRENLKNDDGTDDELEALLAEKLGKKKSEAAKANEEKEVASIENKEEDDLSVDAPFDSEESKDTVEKEAIEEEEQKHDEDDTKEQKEEIVEEDKSQDQAAERDRKEEEEKNDNDEKDSDIEDTSSFNSHEKNPFPPLEEEKKKNFLWPIIYLVLFVAGMATGFIIFDQLSSRKDFKLPNFSSPEPTPTAAPTATPTPETVDLKSYKLRLENGSGIRGEAAKLESAIENEFTVEEVGNADNSNFEETVIQAKNGTNAVFLKSLREALAKTYTVADEVDTLPEDETVDAVVVIGSEKKE